MKVQWGVVLVLRLVKVVGFLKEHDSGTLMWEGVEIRQQTKGSDIKIQKLLQDIYPRIPYIVENSNRSK